MLNCNETKDTETLENDDIDIMMRQPKDCVFVCLFCLAYKSCMWNVLRFFSMIWNLTGQFKSIIFVVAGRFVQTHSKKYKNIHRITSKNDMRGRTGIQNKNRSRFINFESKPWALLEIYLSKNNHNSPVFPYSLTSSSASLHSPCTQSHKRGTLLKRPKPNIQKLLSIHFYWPCGCGLL